MSITFWTGLNDMAIATNIQSDPLKETAMSLAFSFKGKLKTLSMH
jgi:hypothetical protein